MIIKYALNDINLNYRLLYRYTNSYDNIKYIYVIIHCVSDSKCAASINIRYPLKNHNLYI